VANILITGAPDMSERLLRRAYCRRATMSWFMTIFSMAMISRLMCG